MGIFGGEIILFLVLVRNSSLEEIVEGGQPVFKTLISLITTLCLLAILEVAIIGITAIHGASIIAEIRVDFGSSAAVVDDLIVVLVASAFGAPAAGKEADDI